MMRHHVREIEMNDVDTALANNQTVSPQILLWRHVVVLAVVLAVYSKISSAAADDFLVLWPAVCATVFTLSAVIAGLGFLFFTRSERGKTLTTFRNAAWVLSGLLFLDPLLHNLNLRSFGGRQSVKVEGASVSPAPLAPSGGQPPGQDTSVGVIAPVPGVATSGPAVAPRDEQAMLAAVKGVLESAKAAGTVDYRSDKKAAAQFDQFLAVLLEDLDNSGKSAIEVAQEAHNGVLALRSLGEMAPHGANSKAIARETLSAECGDHSGASLNSRRAKLADLRRSYPSLANSDDLAVVRAVHAAFYADLPIACIADALGVAKPRALEPKSRPAKSGSSLSDFLNAMPQPTSTVSQGSGTAP
jgi:hypothetical protein